MEISHPSVAYWEQHFPGRALDIICFLGPLYEQKIELRPLMANLEEVAVGAIFWRKIEGVRVFRRSELALLRRARSRSLEGVLTEAFYDSVSESLFETVFESLSSFVYANITGLSVSITLNLAFVETMVYGVVSAVQGGGKESAKFGPLLGLWLAGNYPIGFDQDDNLLVLVADK